MANDAGRVGILVGTMAEAGVMADISVVDVNATPPTLSTTYDPLMTQEQIDLGNQMIAAFDWRKRRALPRATVVASQGALTIGQRAVVDAHIRAEYLRNNPDLAAKLGLAVGVPLPVDEVDPT